MGLDPDPELAFTGVRALRELAAFCEGYQVRRLRETECIERGAPAAFLVGLF